VPQRLGSRSPPFSTAYGRKVTTRHFFDDRSRAILKATVSRLRYQTHQPHRVIVSFVSSEADVVDLECAGEVTSVRGRAGLTRQRGARCRAALTSAFSTMISCRTAGRIEEVERFLRDHEKGSWVLADGIEGPGLTMEKPFGRLENSVSERSVASSRNDGRLRPESRRLQIGPASLTVPHARRGTYLKPH
jgi:hypothetical protein